MLHVELHAVCKITHYVSNYTLCVKSHTSKLHRSTWGPFVGTFRVNCQKIPLTWKNFPQTLVAAFVTNMRYGYCPWKKYGIDANYDFLKLYLECHTCPKNLSRRIFALNVDIKANVNRKLSRKRFAMNVDIEYLSKKIA